MSSTYPIISTFLTSFPWGVTGVEVFLRGGRCGILSILGFHPWTGFDKVSLIEKDLIFFVSDLQCPLLGILLVFSFTNESIEFTPLKLTRQSLASLYFTIQKVC